MVVLRIYKDGRVKYTTLLNYDVNCPMNFVFYPFDKQASLSDIVFITQSGSSLLMPIEKKSRKMTKLVF